MSNGIPTENLEAYESLVGKFPSIERKGKTMPYTSLNGHMFSYLEADGTLALRLSKEDREQFIEKHNTELMISRGRVMKEYVKVPEDMLLGNKLKTYFGKSLDYVGSLKPKKTKK